MSSLEAAQREVVWRYRCAPWRTRAYIHIRLRTFPKKAVWPILVRLSGPVVSVGAGYGLLETMAALANPAASFVASDANESRIAMASAATKDIPNIRFERFDLEAGLPDSCARTYLLFDVLHHLTRPVQASLLSGLAERLPAGGRIIIKECGLRPVWKLWFNYLTDAVSAPGEATYPRAEQEWADLLAAGGLETHVTRIDRGTPYAHALIEGRKPE